MTTRPLALVALVLAACGGGGGPDPSAPPTALAYPVESLALDHGEAVGPHVPTVLGGQPTSWSVAPPLPPGLTLDAATGAIGGTTTTRCTPPTVYTLTAANAAGSSSDEVIIAVGALASLAPGWTMDLVLADLAKPVNVAASGDGTIYFNELDTGRIRLVRPDGALQAAPFAEVDVVGLSERGLLGLALHPLHATNGWVYVMYTGPTAAPGGVRLRIVRFTATAGLPGEIVGTNETVIVDDLPSTPVHNGGDLCFERYDAMTNPDPRLFATVGDLMEPSLAQTDGSPAGRVHRYTSVGAIPTDNPIPGDSEHCRGLRNTFGMAVHPTGGWLYGVDNGPTANDELNFLDAGKNFEWGGLPPGFPPGDVGIRITGWMDVIAPTAVAWADETTLLVSSFVDEAVRAIGLSPSAPGQPPLNVDDERVVATFRSEGIANKPLDVHREAEDVILVSTFTAIYRLTR